MTSVVSVIAIVRALSMTEAQRLERASDAVTGEVERLAKLAPSEGALATPTTTYVGIRGGWLDGPEAAARLEGLPAPWRAPLADLLAEGRARGALVLARVPVGASTLVLGVAPGRGGRLAWSGFMLAPSSYLRPWRWIVPVLALATGLLVATSLWLAFSWRRSTAALNASLVALGKDLSSPVPPPRVAELTAIADGIRRMAADLQASREGTERLLRELAQKERLAALGRVAAGVAHEVRNPLASIKLRLDLAAASHALPPAEQESVAAASQEIARLDRLVSDLLLVAGKKMGPVSAVSLGALVRARVAALEPWASSLGIAVHSAGEGTASVDAESVARAIDNLVRNAVEASPGGAAVEIAVMESAAGVEVRVSDRGGGVPEARVSELFEPFFTTKADGTGLGLAISRSIARANGGDLVYARAAELTCFSLSLPRTAQRKPERELAA